MTWWEYALWGAFGGFAVDAIEFHGAIRRLKDLPWRVKGEVPPLALTVSVVIRIGVGFGLACAAGQAGWISGPFWAITIGVAAPLLLEQMAKQVPRPTTETPL